MIVSPRMNAVPSLRLSSPSTRSSVSSRTILMWMSKERSVPMYCLLFLSSTIIFLSRARFNASKGRASIGVKTSCVVLYTPFGI